MGSMRQQYHHVREAHIHRGRNYQLPNHKSGRLPLDIRNWHFLRIRSPLRITVLMQGPAKKSQAPGPSQHRTLSCKRCICINLPQNFINFSHSCTQLKKKDEQDHRRTNSRAGRRAAIAANATSDDTAMLFCERFCGQGKSWLVEEK